MLSNLAEQNTIVFAVATIIVVAFLIAFGVYYFKQKNLEDIRADVYKLFLFAEHSIYGTKKGQERLDYVVSKAYELLPKTVKIFISKENLRNIIDVWFKQIKDLLDDGKFNQSAEGDK